MAIGIFTRSVSRRFISETDPAPSITTGLYLAARRSNAAFTSLRSTSLPSLRKYEYALWLPWGLPLSTTCEVWSEFGFSSSGFISVLQGIPAASACTAWARPISRPSGVAKELRAIFCALKGAGVYPSCRKILQNPAATTLLPTSLPVPANIMG